MGRGAGNGRHRLRNAAIAIRSLRLDALSLPRRRSTRVGSTMSTAAHSFNTLRNELATIVRNTYRVPSGAAAIPTFR
jgi:hypothetical protein